MHVCCAPGIGAIVVYFTGWYVTERYQYQALNARHC